MFSKSLQYAGWLLNPNHQLKTVLFIPLFTGFQPSKVMLDFATIHRITPVWCLSYRQTVCRFVGTCSVVVSVFATGRGVRSGRCWNRWQKWANFGPKDGPDGIDRTHHCSDLLNNLNMMCFHIGDYPQLGECLGIAECGLSFLRVRKQIQRSMKWTGRLVRLEYWLQRLMLPPGNLGIFRPASYLVGCMTK